MHFFMNNIVFIYNIIVATKIIFYHYFDDFLNALLKYNKHIIG